MENINLVFKKVRDLFEHSYYYEFFGVDENTFSIDNPIEKEKNYLAQIKEIKKIILKDIRRVKDYQIDSLENNKALIENLQMLIDTYDNDVYGIDTSYFERDITNFILLTDSYLCFNHIPYDVSDDEFFQSYGEIPIR